MAAPVLPHRLAGRYEITEVLGKGGMGLVYRAYDILIHREVAVKTLREIPEPAALQLFHKECDVLASLSHPNIVEIYDTFAEEHASCIVMELLEGETMEARWERSRRRLPVERPGARPPR